MAKKSVKKKKKEEKKEKRKVEKIEAVKELHIEKTLIENFVNLQKVLTNLAVKFEALSDQISKLLQLFEISAKSFVERQGSETGEKDRKKDKEFLSKLDTLLDQNKTIAKGLTLMEEKIRERVYGHDLGIRERGRPRYPGL